MSLDSCHLPLIILGSPDVLRLIRIICCHCLLLRSSLDSCHLPLIIWRAQNDKRQMARIKAHPEELKRLVRSRENLNKVVYWTAMTVMTLLATGFLYNVFSTNQPWIRFGQAWALGLLA